MSSTRLPGKVMLEANGRTLLDHHLDRLLTSDLPIVVATTVNEADDAIVALCESRGVPTFRGSELDVLARYHGCVTQYGIDVVVRVTSDCPLIDGSLIANAAARYLAANDPWLYLSNTVVRSYPRGMDFELFSAQALAYANTHAKASFEREHVTPYMYLNAAGRMRIETYSAIRDSSDYRLTVDTPEDLHLMRRLLEEHQAAELDCDGILEVLDNHPDLALMNQHVEQKKLGE